MNNPAFAPRSRKARGALLSGSVNTDLHFAAMSKRESRVNWVQVEADYTAGAMPLREIGAAAGCSHTAIMHRAEKYGWVRGARPARENLVLGAEDDAGNAGYVYVIFIEDSAGQRFHKIGLSASFGLRFRDHQCASPFEIRVACAYFVGDMRAEERALHELFAAHHVRGEWFTLSPDDLQTIAARCLRA